MQIVTIQYLLVELSCWRELVFRITGPVSQDRTVDERWDCAVFTVPLVIAVEPRQLTGAGGEQVVQGPGYDDIVVEAHVQGNDDDRVANT